MKKVKKYIHDIHDELHGANEYAENYIIYKETRPSWSRMYEEMARAELQHAENLKTMGQEFIDGMSYIHADCADEWDDCIRHFSEKAALVRLMLSK